MNYDPSEWMTYHEAAKFWGVNRTVAVNRVYTRRMPRRRMGRLVLVQRTMVEAWQSVAALRARPAVE